MVLVVVAFGIDDWTSSGPPVARATATVPSGTSGQRQRAAAAAAPRPAKSALTGPVSRTGATVKLGAFRGTSVSQVRSFERWLGRDVDYAVDFSSRDTWAEIADPSYMINSWRGSRYRMVYSVALLPEVEPASITAGAKGAYDKYYQRLARNLVAAGQQDAILRLGWEFNLGSSTWSTSNAKAFVAYWRHVVDAIRSVPGEKLKFDWNVNVGDTTYDGSAYYPGNKYVDYIGVDVYDVSWTPGTYPYPASCSAACRLTRQKRVWDRLYSGQGGLIYWSDFAQTRHKPMSIPEWGLWKRSDNHGGGDDPYFIKQMHAFIDDPQNRIAYQAYFDQNTGPDEHALTSLTQAGITFRNLFH
jgi:hypothetical protein